MKIQLPVLPCDPVCPDAPLRWIEQAHREEIPLRGMKIRGGVFHSLDLNGLAVKETVFENCEFIGTALEKADFTDVTFRSCNLSNALLRDSYMNRCRLSSCKGVGLGLPEGFLQNIIIENSNFQYANFDSAEMKNIAITGSDFTAANLSHCRLTNFFPKETRLISVNFFKTPLKGIDLTDCPIDGLILSGEELKGAIVTAYQAADLARLLGLIVK